MPKAHGWGQLAELHLRGACKGLITLITPLGTMAIDQTPEELTEIKGFKTHWSHQEDLFA